jgi:hypothetical protein
MTDQATSSGTRKVRQLLVKGDRKGALRLLFSRGRVCKKVLASDAYKQPAKDDILKEMSDSFDAIHPFSDEEIVYYNKLMSGEVPCDE